MSKISKAYISLVERFLPSPLVIALLLTLLTFICALLFTESGFTLSHGIDIVGFWQKGMWELLAFTMQMVLILLLGYTLALTPGINKLITWLSDQTKNTAQAAAIVSLFAILLSFINWGLCVIFGAILSKKIADRFTELGKPLNYGLIGAAGYSGMMCWHGGLSGSAPLKVAETNHFLADKIGSIPINETIFSSMNIFTSIALIVLVPSVLFWIGKKVRSELLSNSKKDSETSTESIDKKAVPKDAEDKTWIASALGLFMLLASLIYAINQHKSGENIIDLNLINLIIFGLSIILHGNLKNFMNAINKGISSVSDIIIQFPLYAGIMGIMKYSGLVLVISDVFVQISNEHTFPIFTLISAALVNFFVPSGGGQWAVQGPILVEAANKLSIYFPKVLMAMSYGDQLSNMLQPFWALPLLGLTGLKAKEILPYTSLIFLIGMIVFVTSLLIF